MSACLSLTSLCSPRVAKPLKLKDFSSLGLSGHGFLIKGPVILLPFGSGHFSLWRGENFACSAAGARRWDCRWHFAAPCRGFIAITQQSAGGAFLKESAGQIYWPKSGRTKLGRRSNPVSHPRRMGVFLARLAPAVAFATMAFGNRDEPSCTSSSPGRCRCGWCSKLYSPTAALRAAAYPALALVAAAWLARKSTRANRPKAGASLLFIIFGLVSIASACARDFAGVCRESEISFSRFFFSGWRWDYRLPACSFWGEPLPAPSHGLSLWGPEPFSPFPAFHFLFLDRPSVFISSRIVESLRRRQRHEPPGHRGL